MSSPNRFFRKVALVVGAGGQDGKLAAPLLVRQGYQVFCVYRDFAGWWGSSDLRNFRIDVENDATELVAQIRPDIVLFFAAESKSSEERDREAGSDSAGETGPSAAILGLRNILDAIRSEKLNTKFLFASSSLIFSPKSEGRIDENWTRVPSGEYSRLKLKGGEICMDYLKNHGVHATVVYAFNHESAHRKSNFLTSKLIRAGLLAHQEVGASVQIGSLDAIVDWGYAPYYVDAMVQLVERGAPGDYVMASGEAHSVRELCALVFDYFSLDYRDYVIESPQLLSVEPQIRIGDSTKLMAETGWTYRMGFEDFVSRLCGDSLALWSALGSPLEKSG